MLRTHEPVIDRHTCNYDVHQQGNYDDEKDITLVLGMKSLVLTLQLATVIELIDASDVLSDSDT